MPPLDRIADALAKGAKVELSDVLEIRLALAQMAPEEAQEVEEGAFEALSLIVSAPGYGGDVEMSDLERD